ncbi:MAG: DUF1902 domain-containing protein [Oscillospiraceae bacterium]|jgi:hypothetical protein
MELTIRAIWDDEARVWVAESDDVPGLVLESGSMDALIERLRYAVPEMLALNGTEKSPLQMSIVSQRLEKVAI